MADHLPKFKPGQAVTFTAGGNITGGNVVEVGAADRTVVVAGAASVKALGTAGHDAQTGDKLVVSVAQDDGSFHMTLPGMGELYQDSFDKALF